MRLHPKRIADLHERAVEIDEACPGVPQTMVLLDSDGDAIEWWLRYLDGLLCFDIVGRPTIKLDVDHFERVVQHSSGSGSRPASGGKAKGVTRAAAGVLLDMVLALLPDAELAGQIQAAKDRAKGIKA